MYVEKYCSDTWIVGIRRRTNLAAYLVVGQDSDLFLGPFLGGVLYEIGFGPNGGQLVFNGFMCPEWLMAIALPPFYGAGTRLSEWVERLFIYDSRGLPLPKLLFVLSGVTGVRPLAFAESKPSPLNLTSEGRSTS